MKVERSFLAGRDLTEIADWIAADNPVRAESFIDELEAYLLWIATGPLRYRLRPEIGRDVRSALFGSYIILFRHKRDGAIRVERVVHGKRSLTRLRLS